MLITLKMKQYPLSGGNIGLLRIVNKRPPPLLPPRARGNDPPLLQVGHLCVAFGDVQCR